MALELLAMRSQRMSPLSGPNENNEGDMMEMIVTFDDSEDEAPTG